MLTTENTEDTETKGLAGLDRHIMGRLFYAYFVQDQLEWVSMIYLALIGLALALNCPSHPQFKANAKPMRAGAIIFHKE